jgi:hypothetical protein
MSMRTIAGLVMGALPGITVPAAAGGSLPAPPAGFKTLPMRARGPADGVQAEKASDWNCTSAPAIKLEYGWQALPGGDRAVEMMAQAPQDPPREAAGTRTEPAGKRGYKSGVFEWEKWTTRTLQTGWPGMARRIYKTVAAVSEAK